MQYMKLFNFQTDALEAVQDKNRCAFYMGMGLGKTYVGSEKMMGLGETVNLVVCQKSKIKDWLEHFLTYYKCHALDLTDKTGFTAFWEYQNLKAPLPVIGVINYDLVFRRKDLKELKDFTLMLDESSMIQNETAKRSEFILSMDPKNVILLSGTPVGGKYEKLWSQMRLLGWKITKPMFYNHYVDYHYEDEQGFPRMVVDGYKNEARMKRKMHDHGCYFLRSEDALDLPDQIHQTVKVNATGQYKTFMKDSIVTVEGDELVGDTALVKLLRARQLCGQYNVDKLDAFMDLLESTRDRIIVFYNFSRELEQLASYCESLGRCYSVVNGQVKDLTYYHKKEDSITFIQYQAGSMGLNLQKANRIIYFTPPLSSELFEQSKKRIHRIGQQKTCFYYYLTAKDTIEEKIYANLKKKNDYTQKLFEADYL